MPSLLIPSGDRQMRIPGQGGRRAQAPRLMARSSNEVDLESLLPASWITAHPEHFLTYRRDEAEAAAIARRRRRQRRRAKAPAHNRGP